jgi:hypothetical protein
MQLRCISSDARFRSGAFNLPTHPQVASRETLEEADLHQTRPYEGRMPHLQGKEISLGYALARVGAHHYFHLGEIASVRSRRLGEQVGDYPGLMRECG